MVRLSSDLIARLRMAVDRYGVHERARLIRAEATATARRAKAQDEVTYVLAKTRGPVSLSGVLDQMTAPRPLATVLVKQMVDEGRISASGLIDGCHDERLVTIRLAA